MSTPPASSRMIGLINGFLLSQAISVAATLGLADRMDAPASAEDLAAATGVQPDPLYRLMSALAAAGVFHEDDARRFSLTELGACLRRDAAEPVGAWAVNIGRPYNWSAVGGMLEAVRTGQSGFQHVHGTDAWSYRAAHPDDSQVFDHAMTDLSLRAAHGMAHEVDFSRFARIADIGGGNGALLAAILAAHLGTRGVLFDQPHVVAGSAAVLAPVAGRCEVVSGSFFDAVPAGCDAYMLKSVLHDWDDDKAVTILRVCRATMAASARLLVIEYLIGPPNTQLPAKMMDLTMLVMLGARERSRAEFEALFAAAGLRLEAVTATAHGFSILEAAPA